MLKVVIVLKFMAARHKGTKKPLHPTWDCRGLEVSVISLCLVLYQVEALSPVKGKLQVA